MPNAVYDQLQGRLLRLRSGAATIDNSDWFFLVSSTFLYVLAVQQMLVTIGNKLGGDKTELWFFFSSDTLPYSAMYRDLFVDGGSWDGWSVLGARVSQIELVWNFLQRFFTGNGPDAIVLTSFTFPLLCAAGFLFVLHRVRPLRVIDGSASLLILSFFHWAVARWVADPLFAYMWTGRHGDAGLGTIFVIGLVLFSLQKPSVIRHSLVFAATVLFSMSNPMFLATFVAAVCVTLLLHMAVRQLTVRLGTELVGVVVVAAAFGRWLNKVTSPAPSQIQIQKLINGKGMLDRLLSFDFDGPLLKVSKILDQWPSGAAFYEGALLLASLATAIFVWSSLRHPADVAPPASQTTWAARFVVVFYTVSAWGNVAALLVSGNVHRRYLLIACTTPLLVLLLLGREYLSTRQPLVVTKTVAVVLSVVVWLGLSLQWQILHKKATSPFDYYPPLAKCLDDHADEYPLDYGIATFWVAKPITEFSKKGVRVYQVDHRGKPYTHATNRNWYSGADTTNHSNPHYTFVIEGGRKGNGMRKETIEKSFGTPTRAFNCEKGFRVLVYDPPANDKLQRAIGGAKL